MAIYPKFGIAVSDLPNLTHLLVTVSSQRPESPDLAWSWSMAQYVQHYSLNVLPWTTGAGEGSWGRGRGRGHKSHLIRFINITLYALMTSLCQWMRNAVNKTCPTLRRLVWVPYADSYTASRVSNTASEPKADSERRLTSIFQTRLKSLPAHLKRRKVDLSGFFKANSSTERSDSEHYSFFYSLRLPLTRSFSI